MKSDVAAIVPAAGWGRRLGSRRPKPLVRLNAVPLWVRTLRALTRAYPYTRILMPVDSRLEKRVSAHLKRERIPRVILTAGGRTRAESVYKAFACLDARDAIVLIHDVARPFVTPRLVREVIRRARQKGAAVSAERVTATVKESRPHSRRVRRTLVRDRIFLAQTPQVFRSDILRRGYAKLGRKAFRFTDEASLVEAMGYQVHLVEGPRTNMKITTPEDLEIAQSMIRRRAS